MVDTALVRTVCSFIARSDAGVLLVVMVRQMQAVTVCMELIADGNKVLKETFKKKGYEDCT